jgi:hypothetical protein
MTLAATFLGGAKSRLLPPSIPLRFFVSASIFHILMWIAIFIGAHQSASFRGGLGPALGAVHLLTLGVLTTTAIGASIQLLPVATRRSLIAVWPIRLVFWLVVPGLTLLVFGMYRGEIAVLIFAAVVTTVGLFLFAILLANNLWRATSLPIVAAYGWAALICLVLLAVLGIALAADYELGVLPNHAGIALTHMILGGYGFMGLLALGFSHILVPMFALAAAPAKAPSIAGFVLAVAAILLGTLGALASHTTMLGGAGLVGLGAAAVHLRLMLRALKTGMRKRLGFSFLLIRAAWIMLPVTLLVGLASLFGYAGSNGPTLFGLFLLVGWLLTFLLGILQRILPFLASMHMSNAAGAGPPLMSELTASAALKLHAACHGLAFILLVVSIGADTIVLTQIGSAVGLIGAVSFAWFTINITRRVLVAH